MMKKDGQYTEADWDSNLHSVRMIEIKGERYICMSDLLSWFKSQVTNKFIETKWLIKVFVKLKNSKGK